MTKSKGLLLAHNSNHLALLQIEGGVLALLSTMKKIVPKLELWIGKMEKNLALPQAYRGSEKIIMEIQEKNTKELPPELQKILKDEPAMVVFVTPFEQKKRALDFFNKKNQPTTERLLNLIKEMKPAPGQLIHLDPSHHFFGFHVPDEGWFQVTHMRVW